MDQHGRRIVGRDVANGTIRIELRAFLLVIEAGDTAPTKSQLDVFQMLTSQLDQQLNRWAQIKNDDLPKVSELIKQADLPALMVKEKKSDE